LGGKTEFGKKRLCINYSCKKCIAHALGVSPVFYIINGPSNK